jgi:hypothetical protein
VIRRVRWNAMCPPGLGSERWRQLDDSANPRLDGQPLDSVELLFWGILRRARSTGGQAGESLGWSTGNRVEPLRWAFIVYAKSARLVSSSTTLSVSSTAISRSLTFIVIVVGIPVSTRTVFERLS